VDYWSASMPNEYVQSFTVMSKIHFKNVQTQNTGEYFVFSK